MPLNGRWKIEFPSGWGAPDSLVTDLLKPWKELNLSEEGRAFSGTATYKSGFHLDSRVSPKQVLLDLGCVNMIAKVLVNGKLAGTVWTEPYITDITEQVNNGFNELEIEVTGTWFNRLVYDAGQSEDNRKTWTIKGPSQDEPMISYGLLKPVKIIISD